jgi:DNA-binding winged helix-turn-helix (wHTH) protein
VTIRILADREPYASFADASLSNDITPQGPQSVSIAFLSGPAALDETAPDFLVMPAADFLAMPRGLLRQSSYIVYGPVALMDRAFERGCADYIREPWSISELYARLGRLLSLKFRVGDTILSLSGSVLRGEKASVELRPSELALVRLLVRNAPLLVTREAAVAALSIEAQDEYHALGRCAVSLRHCLESVEPGLGRRLHAVRGLGYRFDADLCG